VEAEEAAFVADRLVCRPDPAQDPDELPAAVVALVLGQEVAVALRLAIVRRANDVDRGATLAELVERGELTRGHGRGDEARAVRDHQAERLCNGGDISRDRHAVRPERALRDQHAVEAARLVRQRVLAQHCLVPGTRRQRRILVALVVGHDPGHFDGHRLALDDSGACAPRLLTGAAASGRPKPIGHRPPAIRS